MSLSCHKLICLLTAVLPLAAISYGQGNTCGVKLHIMNESASDSILGSYAEAFDFNKMGVIHSESRGSEQVFEGLESGFYTFSVQKNGYVRSMYSLNVDCKSLPQGKYELVRVPMYEGRLAESRNVTVQPKAVRGSIDLAAGPLTTKDLARLDNVLNFDAVVLGQSKFPAAAKAVKAGGVVRVQVTVGEKGDVVDAFAVSGHPLLQSAAVEAAKKSIFNPTLVKGRATRIFGSILYNFTY